MIYIGGDIAAKFWRVARSSLGIRQYRKSRWEEKSMDREEWLVSAAVECVARKAGWGQIVKTQPCMPGDSDFILKGVKEF